MTNMQQADPIPTGLKVIVERAVRPVAATLPRKKRMREELLAHVMSVFEEEHVRLGDETAALAATAERFGDPRDVGAQLEAALPAYDRPLFLMERLTHERPGEPPSRHAARCARFITCCTGVASAVAMVTVKMFATESFRLLPMFGLWLLIALLSWNVVYVMTLLTHAMRRALFCPEGRSLARAAGVAGLACLVTAGATLTLHLAVYMNATSAAEQVRRLVIETPAFVLIPLIIAGIASLLDQARGDARQWQELTMDESENPA